MRRYLLVGALCAILGLSAAACKRPVPAPAPPPPPPPTAPVTPPPPPPPPAPAPAPAPPLTDDQIFASETPASLNAKGVLGDVLFDLDSATLRDDGRGAASKNATYLKLRPSVRFTIEGHADSRGTAEYNLALGEQRANAVKDYLIGLGVSAERMITISKGKEQPACTEENEACWQRNRRGFHVITAK